MLIVCIDVFSAIGPDLSSLITICFSFSIEAELTRARLIFLIKNPNKIGN